MNRTSSQAEAAVVTLHKPPRALSLRAAAKAMRLARWVYWRCRLAEFGRGSTIDWPAYVVGGNMIRIGRDVYIHRHARLEALGIPAGEPCLAIGDGTGIQSYVHIGAVASVRIGQGALIGSGVYITDHDHDFSDPQQPPISNPRIVVAPVRIGDYAWLGERVMVLKGVTIGEHSVIGAGSIVTHDIPPYTIAVGSPARVVKRYDRAARAWLRQENP